jgi:ABC-type sugar transport system ATPase subunit
VARTLRLEQFLQRWPGQLSGGQRQRVALGRATIRNPAVFLMDEPLSNLDAILRVQMRDELLRLHERLQTTMIYVTHDQIEAMTMGHRIVVMNNGLVQQVGPPQTVYDMPVNEFVAGFLGSPRINLLQGFLERPNGAWVFRSESFTVPMGSDMEQRLAATSLKPGDQVTLGIRPEDTEVVGPEAQADVQGQVHLIEPIGSDKYVSVHIGEAECMVRTSPRLVVEKGEAINLKLAWQRAHIFDQTGRNVFAVTP